MKRLCIALACVAFSATPVAAQTLPATEVIGRVSGVELGTKIVFTGSGAHLITINGATQEIVADFNLSVLDLSAATVNAARVVLTPGPVTILSGPGTPEGVVTAAPGSLFSSIDTGRLYRKDSGTGNTGWVDTFTPSTSPASPSTSVQFNDDGIFGGDSRFWYDKVDSSLHLAPQLVNEQFAFEINATFNPTNNSVTAFGQITEMSVPSSNTAMSRRMSGNYIEMIDDGDAGSIHHIWSGEAYALATGAADVQFGLAGTYAYAERSGSGNAGYATGGWFEAFHSGSGRVDDVIGVQAYAEIQSGDAGSVFGILVNSEGSGLTDHVYGSWTLAIDGLVSIVGAEYDVGANNAVAESIKGVTSSVIVQNFSVGQGIYGYDTVIQFRNPEADVAYAYDASMRKIGGSSGVLTTGYGFKATFEDVTNPYGIHVTSTGGTLRNVIDGAWSIHDQDDDVDRPFITATPGDTPTMAIAAPSGGVLTVDATTATFEDLTAANISWTGSGPVDVPAGLVYVGTVTTPGVNQLAPFHVQLTYSPSESGVSDVIGANVKVYGGGASDWSYLYATGAQVNHRGSGTIEHLYGTSAQAGLEDGNGHADFIYASDAYIFNGGAGDVGEAYGFSVSGIDNYGGGTIAAAYGFWSADLAASGATQVYYDWRDARGVFAIKEEFQQAVPRLYNPLFAKYTPGAADYERWIVRYGLTGQYGTDDTLYLGGEAGGTGTLRPLVLLGDSVSIESVPGTSAPISAKSGSFARASAITAGQDLESRFSITHTPSGDGSALVAGVRGDATYAGAGNSTGATWGGYFYAATDAASTGDLGDMFGVSSYAWAQGTGTIQYSVGATGSSENYGVGHIVNAIGLYGRIDSYEVNTTDLATAVYAVVHNNSGATYTDGYGVYSRLILDGGTVTRGSGFYAKTPVVQGGATMGDYTAFYSESVVGSTTNPYFLWYGDGTSGSDCNGAGVYRVNHFGIPAYYNPCFAPYTPGAGNFERTIERWGDTGVFGVDNTAYIGVEVGGTGTLRNLNLLGAEVGIMTVPGTYGVIRAGYKSSDGTAGVTVTTCTAFKDGLCISGS